METAFPRTKISRYPLWGCEKICGTGWTPIPRKNHDLYLARSPEALGTTRQAVRQRDWAIIPGWIKKE